MDKINMDHLRPLALVTLGMMRLTCFAETGVLEQEQMAAQHAKELKLHPHCLTAVDPEFRPCIKLLHSVANRADLSEMDREAVSLTFVESMAALKSSLPVREFQIELGRARAFILDSMSRYPDNELFYLVIGALYAHDASNWSPLAFAMIRSELFPQSWDAHRTVAWYLDNQELLLQLPNKLLFHARNAYELAPDEITRLESAFSYYTLLKDSHMPGEAEELRRDFENEYAHKDLSADGQGRQKEPGFKSWWPLAEQLATYCSEAYLTLVRNDQNCRDSIQMAEDDNQLGLPDGWINEARIALDRFGVDNR